MERISYYKLQTMVKHTNWEKELAHERTGIGRRITWPTWLVTIRFPKQFKFKDSFLLHGRSPVSSINVRAMNDHLHLPNDVNIWRGEVCHFLRKTGWSKPEVSGKEEDKRGDWAVQDTERWGELLFAKPLPIFSELLANSGKRHTLKRHLIRISLANWILFRW